MPEISSDKLRKLTEQTKILLALIGMLDETPALQINKPFIDNFGISQEFGKNPALYKAYGFAGHFGIDFLTPWGTEILACDNGEVSRVGVSAGDGFFVELKHDWGFSYYCHFKQPAILVLGQKITSSQVVGYAGNTGRVFSDKPLTDKYRGTHLHFSIKINGTSNPSFKDWVDPLPFFKN